ncbi:hypothetical protein [Xanthomonas campestris]|uniref:hypothetical protein n=1 Tax=Xanthomonas campestris TaxID=339 RepID=UPI00129017F2|nr:hypothetical protein [Xanthomonas campestris]
MPDFSSLDVLPAVDMQSIGIPRMTQLDRIEAKLDVLIAALAEDGEEREEPARTLDGELAGGERDQSMGLD